jgi:hypothetical protein
MREQLKKRTEHFVKQEKCALNHTKWFLFKTLGLNTDADFYPLNLLQDGFSTVRIA